MFAIITSLPDMMEDDSRGTRSRRHFWHALTLSALVFGASVCLWTRYYILMLMLQLYLCIRELLEKI